MNKIYTLLPILGIASVTCAMDNNNNSFDFKKDVIYLDGKRVTQENILSLLPAAPADAQQALAQFEAQHPDLLNQAAYFKPATVGADFKEIKDRIKNENIKNLSKYSLVTQISPNYILKMSLQPHKLFNTSSRIDIGTGWDRCAKGYIEGKNLGELTGIGTTTHQTTSRAINALLFVSAVKEFQHSCISTPKTWLLAINPQANHTFASDATHVVIQEAYDKSKFSHVQEKNSPAETAQNVAQISDKALREYFEVIIKVGLFDTASNLLVDAAGNLMNDDLEQPNDEPSILERDGAVYKKYADQRGHTKTDWDRYEGVRKLYELCSCQPRQKAILEECIKNSPVMKMVAPKGQDLIRGLIK